MDSKCKDQPTSIGVTASLDEGIGKNASVGADVDANTDFTPDGPQGDYGMSANASANIGPYGGSQSAGYESNSATGETSPFTDTSANYGEAAFSGGGFNIKF